MSYNKQKLDIRTSGQGVIPDRRCTQMILDQDQWCEPASRLARSGVIPEPTV